MEKKVNIQILGDTVNMLRTLRTQERKTYDSIIKDLIKKVNPTTSMVGFVEQKEERKEGATLC